MAVFTFLENDVCYLMTYLSVAVVVNFTNINLRTSYIVFAIGDLRIFYYNSSFIYFYKVL